MTSIDQSPAAVLKRVKLQLGDEAELLLQGRVRIIKYTFFHPTYLSVPY